MPAPEITELLDRHRGFWNRDSVSAPLMNVSEAEDSLFAPLHGIAIPLSDGTILSTQGEAIEANLIDPKLILDVEEFPLRSSKNTGPGPQVIGDLLVTRAPLGKMVWVEATLGCAVVPRLDTGSIYSHPWLKDLANVDEIPVTEENPWYDLLIDYARQLQLASDGQYQVVQSLQRGPIDLASAVLGHSQMCFAVYDDPVGLQKLNEKTTEAFIKCAKGQQAQVTPLEGGYTNPFGVWSPGTVVRTQCDVASSVSAQTYKDFFFPFDQEICSEFDYSICHTHSGYLHHMEVLLEDKYPTAVQVSLDTGSTPNTVKTLMPIFKRVLEEKPLFIMGDMTRDELNMLLDELPSKGLCISPWAFNSGE
jgi:hypothetical protein